MEQKLDSCHQPVTGRNILRFALPTIIMTVFNTFYTMVDGLFVSNLIGTDALSAINLTAPAIGLITAVSGMLATGGSAVVMRKMGEGKGVSKRRVKESQRVKRAQLPPDEGNGSALSALRNDCKP